MNFDLERYVNKLKASYKDSNTQANIDKLNKELIHVNSIMKENFELILNREGTLNSK